MKKVNESEIAGAKGETRSVKPTEDPATIALGHGRTFRVDETVKVAIDLAVAQKGKPGDNMLATLFVTAPAVYENNVFKGREPIPEAVAAFLARCSAVIKIGGDAEKYSGLRLQTARAVFAYSKTE